MARTWITAPSLSRTALALTAVGVAAAATAVAAGPARFTSYAGTSGLAAALTLIAGLALVVAALVDVAARRVSRLADVALVAAAVWFAPTLIGWEGAPVARSVAAVAAPFLPPLLVHLVLALPTGRLSPPAARRFVLALYVEAAAVGLLLAAILDPYLDPSCRANCSDNVFLIASLPQAARAVELLHRMFVAGVGVVSVVNAALRYLRSPASERSTMLVATVAGLWLGVVLAAHAVVVIIRPPEDPSRAEFVALYIAGCASTLLVAAAIVAAAIRARARRRALVGVIDALGSAPAPGSLREALATVVGDPDLRIAYAEVGAGGYVNAAGEPVDAPTQAPGRAVTALVRDGERIAVMSHAAALPVEGEFGASVRLGLENERLRAHVLARLRELEASRTRIVEAADAARRRLERDLHDGAQQRLLALSYDVRRAKASADSAGDSATSALLSVAIDDAQLVLEELRDVAHGLYPAILEEAGLALAIAGLTDEAPMPVELRMGAVGRCRAAVESAAYVVVAEAIEDAVARRAGRVVVDVQEEGGRIVVQVEDDGSERLAQYVALADRVAAAGGSIVVESRRLQVEMPCVSS